jgi:hypothetical protein
MQPVRNLPNFRKNVVEVDRFHLRSVQTMRAAIGFSEMSMNLCQVTRRHIITDPVRCNHPRPENFKTDNSVIYFTCFRASEKSFVAPRSEHRLGMSANRFVMRVIVHGKERGWKKRMEKIT